MWNYSSVGLLLLVSVSLLEGAWAQSDPSCPRTLPPALELSGEKLPPMDTWYGSEALAVALKPDGVWKGMGPEDNYRDKLAWWSYGYDGSREPKPALIVTAKRLDKAGPPVNVRQVTNASYAGGWTMLHLIEFPSQGCWEITGTYQGQTLSFIVEVGLQEGE